MSIQSGEWTENAAHQRAALSWKRWGRLWRERLVSGCHKISVSVRTWMGLTCQDTGWDSSQYYRARGRGTVHHKNKQNPLFLRSSTLRQLNLILLVNKGCITAYLSQPLDEDSKGLSIRDALIKHKLLNGAEILKWNTATKALQMAPCGLLYSERQSFHILTSLLVLGLCWPTIISQVLHTNDFIA